MRNCAGGSFAIAQGVSLGMNSKIAEYSTAGCKIFDDDRYIPTHTFYYAADIGSEFKTTTDTSFAAHTANAVYYGNELQPRLDADEYADGNVTVTSTATLSAAAEDSAKTAQFVISSSSKISTPETDWAVTAEKLNGAELTLTEDNRYTFAVTADSKLVAETEYLIKTVTVNCGKGGTVDPMTAQVRKGEQATFTITPDRALCGLLRGAFLMKV